MTAGVSDEVAQELQMPIGPQILDDVEKPMPARPATLKDPGTPDRIVMEQQSLTQSKIDTVVPQLQFDYGYVGHGSPLQTACFLVGADSKKMDMPSVVAATAKWLRDLGYERFCLHGDKE